MSLENQNEESKSLRLVAGPGADFSALATTCVCFANASGGRVRLGIEDGQAMPPESQRVDVQLLDVIRKRVGELTVNVQVAPERIVAPNGGEYIALTVARSLGVASTVDGRYFLRVSDTCRPVVGDDVLRLLSDRPGIPWEGMTALGETVAGADAAQVHSLVAGLRASDRVKSGVKEKSDHELLAHYGLCDGSSLTHLGVLLVGTAAARARLGSAPVVQAIKYDERGTKIHKWAWDDYTLSPLQLIDAIWDEVPDFRETYELPDGLYRQNVPAYDKRVVRELIVNALVHRPYTQRGDIFVNLHPDRLQVCNPGRLPMGVTVHNILHASRRRNDRLATVFHDLKLMEREGSGFDLMYELQLTQGRLAPVVEEGGDSVEVTVRRRIARPQVIRLLAQADATHQLTQRERITLGVLAMSDGLTARELAQHLELTGRDELVATWLGRLPGFGLVLSAGRTQGVRYFVTPRALKAGGAEGSTTLTRMPAHRLRALIEEDVSRYPGSSSGEINKRVGAEVPYRTLKRALDDLVDARKVRHTGVGRGRRYQAAEG